MKTYSKKQISKLTPKVWGAFTSKGLIQIKAILKENALISIQKYDPSFKDVDSIKELKGVYNSHQACLDKVVEKYPGEYAIEITI